MTRARNLAGLGTVTSSPTPVHIGPVGVITATRIDGEFGPRTDIEVRNLSAAGIAATSIWNYNWFECIRNYYCAEWNKF